MKLIYYSILALAVACSQAERKSEPGIQVKQGFIVEKLYTPSDTDQGSWVSITRDDKGRLITSDQYGHLYYVEVPELGSDDSVKVTEIPLAIGSAQGLLWAYNSLYVMVNKDPKEESGLYRVTDSNSDGKLDQISNLHHFSGAGEHGPHAVVLGPDGLIYIIAGNHTDLPEQYDSWQKPIWDEDRLFPAIKDPRGHANSRNAPGGWIARMEPDGSNLTIIANGFRNSYDIAFNEDEELFTFDSDMEWDLGTAWYRPVRVCHITPGAEFGWRTGSAKWPSHFPDNLAGVIDVGQGSPTGLLAAKDLDFPYPYNSGLFIFDWSFGTMYHVALTADGSSYTGSIEEFLGGPALPLTDGVAGDDGALYFLTGGRRLQSHLFRVFYSGPAVAEPATKAPVNPKRDLRLKLTQIQKDDPANMDIIWASLADADRRIRYSARVALEYQPNELIESRFSTEGNPDIILNASLAIARTGESPVQRIAWEKLLGLKFENLSENQKLILIRAYSLLLIRGDFGEPDLSSIRVQLSDEFPADSRWVNWDLVELLSFLNDPAIVPKAMTLMAEGALDPGPSLLIGSEVAERSAALQGRYGDVIERMKVNSPNSALMHYVRCLSHVDRGWTPQLREDYFRFFATLMAANGGASYSGFILKIRDNALAHVPPDLQPGLKKLSGEELQFVNDSILANLPQPQGPGKNWQKEEVLALLKTGVEPDLANGAKMYQAALCGACHAYDGQGGNVGPDLTQVATRFSTEDLVEAIMDPDKTISDQYAATEFLMVNDRTLWGRVLAETDDTVSINMNPMRSNQVTLLPKADIREQSASERSIMYPALLNRLNEQEVRDLIHFLQTTPGPS